MLKTHISITDAERAVEEIARLKRSMRCSTRLTKPLLFLAPVGPVGNSGARVRVAEEPKDDMGS
jgi:hypothetical protein